MGKKKGTSSREVPDKRLQANSITTKTIKGRRERRAVDALLRNRKVNRDDLDRMIGASNSPEYVRRIRGRGVVVYMNRAYLFNRDGEKYWRGEYSLCPKSREVARQLLGKTLKQEAKGQ